MKYLIVGLGNPGEEYENTRHNIGFKILDALCEASNISFTPDKHAHLATVKFKGRTLHLVKPTTFMNLSGKAVNYWLQKHKVDIKNLKKYLNKKIKFAVCGLNPHCETINKFSEELELLRDMACTSVMSDAI